MTAIEPTSARSAGILLHPTSLPGPYGIGDLGPAARNWIDLLVRTRQKWWQILPLGPTGYGDSPYQCFSAFAGNPYLISPQLLVSDGLISDNDLTGNNFARDHVAYGRVIAFKWAMLKRAWENFGGVHSPALRLEYDAFRAAHASWLDDYGLFMALKDAHNGRSWQEWPDPYRLRYADPLAKATTELADLIGLHKFGQFLFWRQWQALRAYATLHGIHIIGDIPIFVSGDSADVWAHPEMFTLDGQRRPAFVAGVPPDYFSATGQLWGNPLYNWENVRGNHYSWWIERLKSALAQVDLVRLDHFRGFESYWEIPAGMPTAEVGRWVKAPGKELLEALTRTLGRLPLIAEDLGVITPPVLALRDAFHLPGMRILQFAFDGKVDNRFLPHNYEKNTVVYTGTHDNDTTWGWYRTAPEYERDNLRRYLARDGNDVSWDLIRVAWSSVADWAIAPLQDILNLGAEARMNQPGKPDGNWTWRLQEHQLAPWALDRLAEITALYGRD